MPNTFCFFLVLSNPTLLWASIISYGWYTGHYSLISSSSWVQSLFSQLAYFLLNYWSDLGSLLTNYHYMGNWSGRQLRLPLYGRSGPWHTTILHLTVFAFFSRYMTCLKSIQLYTLNQMKKFWLGLSIPEPNLVIGHPYLYDIIFLSQMKFQLRLIIKVDSNKDQSPPIMQNIYNKEKEKRKRKRKSNKCYWYWKVPTNED